MNNVPYVGGNAQHLSTQPRMPFDEPPTNHGPPRLLANAGLEWCLDVLNNPFAYLSGQRSVANRAAMAKKIIPLIRRQLKSGRGLAGLDLRMWGSGPSIVFADGRAMSIHELPRMARAAGMVPGNVLVVIRDGLADVLNNRQDDTYQQFVWASRATGLRIEVVTDGRSWTFTPNMNPRPGW
jgi:hypothetical protein